MTLDPPRPHSGDPSTRPLIVTLATDPTTQHTLTALRKAHFPPSRSYLDAHITLFHDLPGDDEPAVRASLAELASRWRPFGFEYGAPSLHGRVVLVNLFGVASLVACHGAIRRRWLARLGNQDKQGFKAHVTILNKTDEEHAKRVFDEVSRGMPDKRPAQAVGLDMWRYMGGPWEHVERFEFKGAAAQPQKPVNLASNDDFPALGR